MSHNAMQPFLDDIKAKMARRGWAVISVMGEEMTPPMSYSVGLTKLGLPEILVFGLPPDVGQRLINMAAERMREQGTAMPLEEPVAQLASYPVVFRRLPDAGRLRIARFFFDDDIAALQMFWPDEAGRFPWQEGFDERFRDHQLMLGVAEVRQ